jgi:outer membrane protein TolC
MRHILAVVLAATAAVAGCTPAQYAHQADKTAYKTIDAAQEAALGAVLPFDVAYRPYVAGPATQPSTQPSTQPATQPAGTPASGPASMPAAIQIGDRSIPLGGEARYVMTLDDALHIAFRNNRQFQTEKEDLYIKALALANFTRAWDWVVPGGSADASISHIRTAGDGETNTAAAGINPTITRKFAQGGVLTLGAALDWATHFTGSDTAKSLVSANFTQPLVRGAWRDFAIEPEYRLTRDFIFAVYDYERYTQTFAADVVQKYYNVLRQRDQLENERANIERLRRTLRYTKVLVDAGQASLIEQDQAETNLLSAEVRLQQSQQSYEDALDGLKVYTLGLPLAAAIELDYPSALKQLNGAGAKPMPLDERQAMTVALAVRPDVLTQGAKVRDASRNVEIAADQFNPQVDLTLGISAVNQGKNDFGQIEFGRHTRSAAMTFNYALDQTDNRDAYRRSLIALDRARRDYDEFIERVQLEVRATYRSLQQSRVSYELQKRNVQIATRRSKLASLQQQEGLASARDVLEAEEALRQAQNGLTSALVSYATTRLTFMATLGLLDVDPDGKAIIDERAEPFTFELIRERYPYVEPAAAIRQ